MKHRRRPKPQRRQRCRRVVVVHKARLQPARLFRIYPDKDAYPRAVVEVRLCRDTRRMCESIRQRGWLLQDGDEDSAGLVKSFGRVARPRSASGGRLQTLLSGRTVAQMWLSMRELRRRPGELTSHECGHAAMAWARWRGANLGVMPGEEVMCYALGRLVAQINRVCYAAGAFG